LLKSKRQPAEVIELFDLSRREPARVLAWFAGHCDDALAWENLSLIARDIRFPTQSMDGVDPDRVLKALALLGYGGKLTAVAAIALIEAGFPAHAQTALSGVREMTWDDPWPKAGAIALLGRHTEFLIALLRRQSEWYDLPSDIVAETKERLHAAGRHSVADSFVRADPAGIVPALEPQVIEAWINHRITVAPEQEGKLLFAALVKCDDAAKA
jgi:hypothetical protein